MPGRFVDISGFQPQQIDFNAYKIWSSQDDGISRIAMRSSYGIGYVDQNFQAYRAGALLAGIDEIYIYHYAYPQFNDPISEANFMHSVVGSLRPNDRVFLDYEENVSQATAQWAYEWLSQSATYWGQSVGIYADASYIASHLQYVQLTQFHLWYADWTFDPNSRPLAPFPWTSYEWLQYTDRATNIPGINATVDADIFIGGKDMGVPTGWTDDGTTLTAPTRPDGSTPGYTVVQGFRSYILNNSWDAGNIPLQEAQGLSQLELGNPSLGGGTQQIFRWSVLEWDQANNVFIMWTGQEILALRAALALAQSQLNANPIVEDVKALLSAFSKLQSDLSSL